MTGSGVTNEPDRARGSAAKRSTRAMVASMVKETNHSTCVDAWLGRNASGVSTTQLLQVFEQGFGVLWRRAHRTLGEVTLTAIVDRVLYTAAERYSPLSAVEVDAAGIRCPALHERAASLDRVQLAEGVRFVLVEFLTVLGNLTADILTPALHSELSKVAPGASDLGENESHGETPNRERHSGDAKS